MESATDHKIGEKKLKIYQYLFQKNDNGRSLLQVLKNRLSVSMSLNAIVI